MLVLSRKQGEEIIIGGVRVRVVELTSTRVKLAFHAPADVPIHRSEVAESLQAARCTDGEFSPLLPDR